MEVPKYVLSLDELPVVVQAGDRVHPVFMTTRDAARLFDVTEKTVRSWLSKAGIAVFRPWGEYTYYVEVAKIANWIRANSSVLEIEE